MSQWKARSVGRPGLRVADRRSVAADPHSGASQGPRLQGLVLFVVAAHRASGLAEAKSNDGPDGRARRSVWRRWTSIRLGLMDDPETDRRRVVWALIIVLAYSRHSFVWPTFSQKLVDVIEGLEAAWAFF